MKTGGADILAQKFLEKKEKIDVRRSEFELFLNSNTPARCYANPFVTMQIPVSLQHCRSPYLDMPFLVLYNTDGLASCIRGCSSGAAANY